uniref:Uncharacterized protein n=1 Tax=Romanomermis culicivorax TaxID=13658 RepID=A0A915I178_ROMCU
MPPRLICWQSYSSTRSNVLHSLKYPREWSVINGQLSKSKIFSLSFIHKPMANCLIPSSVINSQLTQRTTTPICIEDEHKLAVCLLREKSGQTSRMQPLQIRAVKFGQPWAKADKPLSPT